MVSQVPERRTTSLLDQSPFLPGSDLRNPLKSRPIHSAYSRRKLPPCRAGSEGHRRRTTARYPELFATRRGVQMPAKRLSMRKIKEVLRLKWVNQLSNRQIAKACNIIRNESAGEFGNELTRAVGHGFLSDQGGSYRR